MGRKRTAVAGVCGRCGTGEPEAFTSSQRVIPGAWCKACHAAYRREGRFGKERSRGAEYQDVERAKRVDWLRNEKSKRGCQRCGERDAACLDFHHTDESTKAGQIGTKIHQWGKAKIEAEIAKTIVLCSNCHRKLHFYKKSGTFARIGKGLSRPKRE